MPTETSATSSSPGRAAAEPLDPSSVEGIFVEALKRDRGQPRSDFLDEACRANAELRTRVEALLRAYDDAGSFLQKPAGDWRNPPVTATSASGPGDVDDHGIPRGLLRASDKPGVLGMIGSYEVRELIGRGGMGIVLRAFDAKLNRVVAIKVLAPELAVQAIARRRFLREAQAAAAVAHPHVVTIHAVDEDERPYLVMECIEGISLQDKIERAGTLKLAEVLRIGTQIADGLAAAHKQGLIHRDVKPANILLENGVQRVKITDFGLARATDDVTITRPGEISGTPQYMSPEQASGERVDQRSDLFSLGCVLYAMCAGRPPFRADSMAAIVKKICQDTPQPLREIDQQIPQWLTDVIDRLLAKDPQERFQTAEEVARILGGALAQVQAGQAVTRAVSHPRAAMAVPRVRWRLPILLGIVMTCAAGYWFGRLFSMRISGQSRENGWFIGTALACIPVLAFWIARVRFMSLTRSVASLVCASMVFFAASAMGHEQLHLHPSQSDAVDWLAIAATLLAGFLTWRMLRQEPAEARSSDAAPAPFEPISHPSSWRSQPWKVAGWLAVVLLSLVLLGPILLAIGLIVPYYQAHQSRQDAQAWQATMARLTMTFDEDLPIVDIQIDGTSAGPVEISPVERGWSAGAHTITVVYTHGERKRSVRKAVHLAPNEDLTLDLTPLVVGDIEERDRQKRDSERRKQEKRVRASPSPQPDESHSMRGDELKIVWGPAAREVQLGWHVEPEKESYLVGDKIKVTLFLRNVDAKPIQTSIPRTQVLEKLGLDIDFRDADDSKLSWRWGGAHAGRDQLEVSGALGTTLEPSVPFELPPFVVAIDGAEEQESETGENLMVELRVKRADGEPSAPDELSGQTAYLTFRLSSIGYARGNEADLSSAPFKFQIGDRSPVSDAKAAAPAVNAWGDLTGKFVYDGPEPIPARLVITKDEQVCGKHDLHDESLELGEGKSLKNVVIFLADKKAAVHPDYEATAQDTVDSTTSIAGSSRMFW